MLSTYELIETDADLRVMRSVVENGRYLVEANDMGAVNLLAGRGPFVAGPFLNVYNHATLALLAGCGAQRWVAPVELSGAGVREVMFVLLYGRVGVAQPDALAAALAFSAVGYATAGLGGVLHALKPLSLPRVQ